MPTREKTVTIRLDAWELLAIEKGLKLSMGIKVPAEPRYTSIPVLINKVTQAEADIG